MSFLTSVSSFAKPFVKVIVAADPLVQAKAKFAAVADEQSKLLKEKAVKGFWFATKDGVLVVSLKNGAAVLPGCVFQVKTAADAIKLIEQAKKAATAGEFDQLFVETQRKPVQRKAKPAAAPATPASK